MGKNDFRHGSTGNIGFWLGIMGKMGFWPMGFREEEHEKSMKILGVACCGSLEISGCG